VRRAHRHGAGRRDNSRAGRHYKVCLNTHTHTHTHTIKRKRVGRVRKTVVSRRVRKRTGCRKGVSCCTAEKDGGWRSPRPPTRVRGTRDP